MNFERKEVLDFGVGSLNNVSDTQNALFVTAIEAISERPREFAAWFVPSRSTNG